MPMQVQGPKGGEVQPQQLQGSGVPHDKAPLPISEEDALGKGLQHGMPSLGVGITEWLNAL